MSRSRTSARFSLAAQAGMPPSALFPDEDFDLSPYRHRTLHLLRRYARASVEIGRLPSLLGREFFRTHVTSYSVSTFEDIVIFVIDIERVLQKLSPAESRIIAMYALEEYTILEVSRLLARSERTVERLLHDALDQLSSFFLDCGLLQHLPEVPRQNSCQDPEYSVFSASDSNQNENNSANHVGSPPSVLIS